MADPATSSNQPPEQPTAGKGKKISMENTRPLGTAVATKAAGGNGSKPTARSAEDTVKYIVNYLVKAQDLELLQLTPIPKNAIFDLAYDVVQRAILDPERIKNRIPLSAIFFEAYLRGVRGANAMLSTGMISMAQTQVEGQAENGADMPTYER